ncbi:hypothetical protein [Lawsonibacter hominis]|uniref:hypothetical protein n=1 Tax=Lawsonibacter hominis TaxID=2763053 RepID=UPI00332A6291
MLIADVLACCAQGIEFVWEGHSYPDDFPELETVVTVVGQFETYQEDGDTFCHPVNAELI